MGTRTEIYVIYGIDFDYNLFCKKYLDENDNFLEDINKNKEDDLIAVFDGMSGGYAIFGELLGKGEEFEGLELTAIDTVLLNKDRLLEKLKKYFKMDEEDMQYFIPKIYALSHFH